MVILFMSFAAQGTKLTITRILYCVMWSALAVPEITSQFVSKRITLGHGSSTAISIGISRRMWFQSSTFTQIKNNGRYIFSSGFAVVFAEDVPDIPYTDFPPREHIDLYMDEWFN